MANKSITLNESIKITDTIHITQRKVLNKGTEDLLVARFFFQNINLIDSTEFTDEEKSALKDQAWKLAETIDNCRNSAETYLAKESSYIQGINSGSVVEVGSDREIWKLIFDGKKDFEEYLARYIIALRQANFFWGAVHGLALSGQGKEFLKLLKERAKQVNGWSKLLLEEVLKVNDLLYKTIVLRNQGLEHSIGLSISDFSITKNTGGNKVISLEKPKIVYPKQAEGFVFEGQEASKFIEETFTPLWTICESIVVFSLYEHLASGFKPQQISLQAMDPKCPVRWTTTSTE